MSIDDVTEIRIHPGIGMARVGNSTGDSPDDRDFYFIGPEAPSVLADPSDNGSGTPGTNTWKDSRQRMKRQAQRFRIYGYDAGGNVVAEINSSTAGVSSIEWKVHVRNLKAANYAFEGAYLYDPTKLRNPTIQGDKAPVDRDQLIVDPGAQTIASGASGPVTLQDTIFDGVPAGTLPGALKFDGVDSQPGDDVPVSYSPATVTLGELRLDDEDRLLFVPGPGVSESCTTPAVVITNPSEHWDPPNGPDPDDQLTNQFSYFNVPGWYDDTCGGSIDVTVTLEGGTVLSTLNDPGGSNESRNAERGAWVVSAPPKYAPDIYHVVSILDRVYQTFPDADPNMGETTDFYRDIYPILKNATDSAWVSAEAFGPQGTAHGPGQPGDLLSSENLAVFEDPTSNPAARKQIYAIMRHSEDNAPPAPAKPPPTPAPKARPAGDGPQSRGNLMPKLWGTGGKPLQNEQLGHNLPNQYLSLTPGQLERMKDWAAGDFVKGSPPDPKPLDQVPLADQPTAMDEAALQPTIGGGFHPGIEFPYLILYDDFFAGAFRVAADVEPGSVAAYMSCPWQGDFWSCNTAWWPAQRPEIVVYYEQDLRRYKEWFRGVDPGTGDPLSSTDGYDQMVRVWWQLGMVIATDQTDQGETVYQEEERDPALDGS